MSDDRRSASGTGWRRPVLGAIGAVAVIVAVAAVVTRDDEPVSLDASPYSGPLPTVEALATRAPEATGSVSGFVGTGCRGSEDCEGGRPARLDLAALDAPEELPRAENVELGDGRWLESTPTGGTAPWGERAMPEWWLVDPADEVVLVERHPQFVMGLRKNWGLAGMEPHRDGERRLAEWHPAAT